MTAALQLPSGLVSAARARPDLEERIQQLEAEREMLHTLLAQQQRIAQAGLVTSGLAHDVGNHVQVVTGIAYLALRKKHQPAEMERALEKIQERCCALTETVESFLGFVRRRSEDETRTFEARAVLDETARLGRTMARDRGVALELRHGCDARITGDRRLVIQVLVNLVANAVKAFGEGGGHVVIRSSPSPSRGCRFTVQDDGPGIPEELRTRLFRPFVTSHDDDGGHGLGLFIVRQNVRRLGGGIRVRTSDEGTTFHIDLPAVVQAAVIDG